jgi:hypothetical protein
MNLINSDDKVENKFNTEMQIGDRKLNILTDDIEEQNVHKRLYTIKRNTPSVK